MNFPGGWQLPDAITSRLGERSGRQRAMIADGHLLLVLHKVPRADSAEREGALFWRSPDGEWHGDDGKRGVATVREHLNRYDKAVEEIEASYEQAASAQEYFGVLEAIVPLHRATSNQYAALQAAREGLQDVRELITMRDIAGDIERAADLLHADAKNALDYQVARQAERQSQSANEMAESGHRLNLMAALFLPASVLAGAFGTSLNSGLEDAPPWVFWSVLMGSFMIGIMIWAMTSATARRRK